MEEYNEASMYPKKRESKAKRIIGISVLVIALLIVFYVCAGFGG